MVRLLWIFMIKVTFMHLEQTRWKENILALCREKLCEINLLVVDTTITGGEVTD